MIDGQDDSQTERSQFRTALLLIVGLLVILIGVTIFVFFKDAPPPEDRHLLPADLNAVDNTNPLAKFADFILQNPPTGLKELSPEVELGIRGAEEEMQDLLNANAHILKLWDSLSETDPATWRWPIDKSTRTSVQGSKYLSECLNVHALLRTRGTVLTRKNLGGESITQALNMLRYGKGLQSAHGSTMNWMIAHLAQLTGMEQLEYAVISQEFDSATLREIQPMLAQCESSLKDLIDLVKINYFLYKNTLLDLDSKQSALASMWRDSGIYLFRKNKTLHLYIDHVTPVLNAATEGHVELFNSFKHLADKLEYMEKADAAWFSTNAAGIESAISYLYGMELPIDVILRDTSYSRMATINLALRQYELQHGHLPESLNSLIPIYLETVPLDPYDGQTMRWNKSTQVLYSTGQDQTDQQGEITTPRNIRSPDWGCYYWWGEKAAAYRLNREKDYAERVRKHNLKGAKNAE